MDLTAETKKIIATNTYLTIATSDGENPWISPVHYGVDENYIFYFCSMPISHHSKLIEKNPNVAFAIFDSTAPEGKGIGIQVRARAELLPEAEYQHALKYYKSIFVPTDIEKIKKSPYKFYKLTPTEIYITDPKSDKDERAQIKL